MSVVLIEREQPTRTPLPVLTRGPGDPSTGRDAGVDVRPSLLPTVPTLVSVTPENGQPAARLGETVTLGGYNLDHGDAVIRFTEPETRSVLELAPATAPSPSSIRVQLPAGPPLPPADPLAGSGADPGQWRIGAYAVHVLMRPGAGRPDRETNSLPLVLAPLATPSASAVAEGTAITVGCSPPIRQDQPVSVIVGQEEIPVPALEADTDSVTVTVPGLPGGASLPVRLRVAGIDSLLIDRTTTPPLFDASQIVQGP